MCFDLTCFFFVRYVTHPEGGRLTADWLKSGQYQLESMGQRYQASIHLKSPFDSDNSRVKVSCTKKFYIYDHVTLDATLWFPRVITQLWPRRLRPSVPSSMTTRPRLEVKNLETLFIDAFPRTFLVPCFFLYPKPTFGIKTLFFLTIFLTFHWMVLNFDSHGSYCHLPVGRNFYHLFQHWKILLVRLLVGCICWH